MADTLICIDQGTTNTRAWLVTRDAQILAQAQAQIGARDTARDKSNARLRQSLATLITQLAHRAPHGASPAAAVIAAGMITSALGLMEIPHLPAPAGLPELSAATTRRCFPDISPLPIYLVPGVRTLEDVHASPPITRDIMRGEETLCIGLLSGVISAPALMLNLGSHWKAIRIDDRDRICSSVTSLSGELIHAAQCHTILASAVPETRPDELPRASLDAGMQAQRREGLARALFRVRLLELAAAATPTTPAERYAFLVGAFIASDLDALRAARLLDPAHPVVIAGHPSLAQAWRHALAQGDIRSRVLAPQQVETAMLKGLLAIARW